MSVATDIINTIRPFLEALYFLASICLVATIIIGIRQVNLVKKDLETRNKRAAVEKSIEYLNWFANSYIPQSSTFMSEVKKKNLQVYNGPFNKDFVFDANCKLQSKYIRDYIIACSKNYGDGEGTHLLNQLEFLSAAVLNGLADEELLFNPIANFFCRNIEFLYVLICYHRRDEQTTSFSNIIKLYDIWKSKLNKIELENKRNKLDMDLANIKEQKISSIGL